jgi:hypothetical protein
VTISDAFCRPPTIVVVLTCCFDRGSHLNLFVVLAIFTIYHRVIFFGRWTLSAFTYNEIVSTKEGYICLCYESRNSSKLKYLQISPYREGLSPIVVNITFRCIICRYRSRNCRQNREKLESQTNLSASPTDPLQHEGTFLSSNISFYLYYRIIISTQHTPTKRKTKGLSVDLTLTSILLY